MARSPAAAQKLAEMRTYVDGVAKKLADDLYGPQGLPWGTRLGELEDMAVTFREAISAKMMEIAVERQAASAPPPDDQNCPGCRRETQPRKAEPRTLDTDGGVIAWDEPQKYCRKCRRSFFPSVEEFGDRPAGLQSEGAGEDRVGRDAGAVVCGGGNIAANAGGAPESDPGPSSGGPPEWEPPAIGQREVTVTRAGWAKFGPQLAAAAWEQGLSQAERRAFVGDGARNNWTVWRNHFSSFTPVLDFIHALTYVFAAAQAGRTFAAGWECYGRWITDVWQGNIAAVIAELASRQAAVGVPTQEDGEGSIRRIVARSLTYLQNNQERMRYADYRREGLPIPSSHIESTIKQINQRVKGTEKFWTKTGSESVLQLRADLLSDSRPLDRFWKDRPTRSTGQRPYQQAA